MPSQVILGPESGASGPVPRTSDWRPVLLLVALMLCMVGAADLVILWIPLRLGVTEYEFATISRFMSGLPVLTMGLGLLVLYGRAVGSRLVLTTAGIVIALVFAAILGSTVLFALDIPIAIKSTPAGALQLGIKKSIANALIQAATYAVGYPILLKMALFAGR